MAWPCVQGAERRDEREEGAKEREGRGVGGKERMRGGGQKGSHETYS
jgi:hypothetical protein